MRLACLMTCLAWIASAWAETMLIGVGSIPGTATDLSGLTNSFAIDQPHNLLGSFGSGLAYTGTGNLYVAVNDRGYADGTTNYIDRFQVLRIDVTPGAGPGQGTVTPTLAETRLLVDEAGQHFVGLASAFTHGLRLDPEGIRVSRNGTIFVSDEYGPFIYEFDRFGQRMRTLRVPSTFLIPHPSAIGTEELPPNNTLGRQANRGMEGLAITPDGSTLYGIMQSPLIQDGALNAKNQRHGINLRILRIDLVTNATAEYLYQLESRSNGASEILAVNDHQFLVLERDGSGGTAAAFKKIFLIDIAGASDISSSGTTSSNGLPPTGLPSSSVMPVSKTLFIDLLDPRFGLAGPHFPEKIEGLAFGPDLASGQHLLLVINDNDLVQSNPSFFYAFRFDDQALPGFQPQVFDVPFAATVPEPRKSHAGARGASQSGAVQP